jgi:hypothetical protein
MTPEDAFYKCFGNDKRDEDLELIIIKDPEFAFYYANHVIKGRWLEAESIIATNSQYAYLYAKEIIKGKLPENMHNTMLIHADYWSKLYFDYIKYNTQP